MERLDELKSQVKTISEKIESHKNQISRLEERQVLLEKEIFALDEGRFLLAAKRAAEKNPEFAKLVAYERERIELEKAVGKRGRPSKTAPAASQIPPNPAPIAMPKATVKK